MISADSTIKVALNHPSLALRERRENHGGNGKNCGVINVQFFARPDDEWFGQPLYELAADQALQHPAFVERWTASGLFMGKRARSAHPPSAAQVASYIRRGNMVSNLTLALMAKAIKAPIYVVSYAGESRGGHGVAGYKITKFAHDTVLDADARIGTAVGMSELLDDFQGYLGPVLLFKGNGHWSAYPLRSELGDAPVRAACGPQPSRTPAALPHCAA